MKAIQSNGSAGLDGLRAIDLPDPGQPGAGEIRVRLHATSLNFHDLGVVTGRMGAADGRIPMSDGAGLVEAVGS
jgi:NADPH:quinone reductase-like Zn-dependent oxidoreductase